MTDFLISMWIIHLRASFINCVGNNHAASSGDENIKSKVLQTENCLIRLNNWDQLIPL